MSNEPDKKNSETGKKPSTGKNLKEKLSSLNKNTLGILICAAVLILTLIIYLAVGAGHSSGEKKAQTSTARQDLTSEQQDLAEIGDSNLQSVKTDAKSDNKPWKTMNDDDYSIEIGSLSKGYSGAFVEDGTDEEVKNVLALQFKNSGSKAIQYAEYVFTYGKDTVSFKLSDLPAGQSCVVLEAGRHEFEKKESPELISRVVAQVDEIPFARDEVLVVDNSDNTLTIMNLTDKEIPLVRVFYKNYDSEDSVFFGGITYTATAEKIPAGNGVTVAPEHFKSGDSVVVGSGIYDK